MAINLEIIELSPLVRFNHSHQRILRTTPWRNSLRIARKGSCGPSGLVFPWLQVRAQRNLLLLGGHGFGVANGSRTSTMSHSPGLLFNIHQLGLDPLTCSGVCLPVLMSTSMYHVPSSVNLLVSRHQVIKKSLDGYANVVAGSVVFICLCGHRMHWYIILWNMSYTGYN